MTAPTFLQLPCSHLSPVPRTVMPKQPGLFILYSGGVKITIKTLQKSILRINGALHPPWPMRYEVEEEDRRQRGAWVGWGEGPGSAGVFKGQQETQVVMGWAGDWGFGR